MNAACLKCNLKTLNQNKHLAQGDYAKQFQIDEHSSNKDFVKNPYVPKKCDVSDLVAFSLTKGSSDCQHDKSLMLNYDSQGRIRKVPEKRHY